MTSKQENNAKMISAAIEDLVLKVSVYLESEYNLLAAIREATKYISWQEIENIYSEKLLTFSGKSIETLYSEYKAYNTLINAGIPLKDITRLTIGRWRIILNTTQVDLSNYKNLIKDYKIKNIENFKV